ncbi:hypothetical protein DM53_4518 [Burkholderia mallei]|nr:hypothetical protein DM53_4518 [Burkholderia mallei]
MRSWRFPKGRRRRRGIRRGARRSALGVIGGGASSRRRFSGHRTPVRESALADAGRTPPAARPGRRGMPTGSAQAPIRRKRAERKRTTQTRKKQKGAANIVRGAWAGDGEARARPVRRSSGRRGGLRRLLQLALARALDLLELDFHVAREHILGRTLVVDRNIRRERAFGPDAAHRHLQRLQRMRDRIHHGGGLEAAVDHAVRTLFVVADAVVVPVGRFHQLLEGLHVTFADQVARLLPAEHRARRVAPRRALVRLVAGEEIEEQRRLAERPALAAFAALEDFAEQVLRLVAVQEVLLIRRALVRVARRHGDAVDADRPQRIEELRDAFGERIVEQRAVDVHAEAAALRFADRRDGLVVHAFLRHRVIVHLPVAVEMDRPDEVRARRVIVHLLFHQQRVRAQVDELLALHDALDDFRHFLVQQRLAARDRHHGRAALVDGLQAFLDGQALVQNRIRIVDLAAAVAREVAAEEGLEHQRERIAFVAGQVLAHDVRANADLLEQRNRQGMSSLNFAGDSLRELRRQLEFDFFLAARHRRDLERTERAQRGDHVLDHFLGRRRAGREAHRARVREPFGADFRAVRDEIARHAAFGADLAQPVRVRAVRRADDEQHVDLFAQLAHRRLAVLRRVADVARVRADDVGEPALQRLDDAARVVHRQRRLRHVRDGRVGRQRQRVDLGLALDEDHLGRNLPDRAFDFRMAGVADQDQPAAGRDVLTPLHVHLRDERAGCVEDVEAAGLRILLDGLRDAVRAEDGHGAVRHFVEFLNESRPFISQVFDYVPIMDDLVTYIDRRAVLLQRALDDPDRADNPRTKAARLGKDDSHIWANSDD